MTSAAKKLIICAIIRFFGRMPIWNVRRRIVSAQLLTQLASEHGMPVTACLAGTSLTAEQLGDPNTEIEARQELQLVRNLVGRLGTVPGIGLDAGLRYHLSAYGTFGFALISSPNLRSAIQIGARYLDLTYAFVRYALFESADAVYVRLDDSLIPDDVRTFLVERDFAAFLNAAREMMPAGLLLQSAQLRGPAPAYRERFCELLGFEPVFGASDNRLFVERSQLDAPLPQADPLTVRRCEEQCRQLLARRQIRHGVAGRVRDSLLQAVGRMPDIDTVAGQLCMATRTLQRQLACEGTSFRALIDEVREALAEELLTSAHLKLDEVSERLGYAEPASFIHAFKRWKGVPPGRFRGRAES